MTKIFKVEVTDEDHRGSRVEYMGKARDMAEAIEKATALATANEGIEKPVPTVAEFVGKLDF